MTKTQYKRARRMIRDNGRSAYAWIARQCGGDWTAANALRDLADAKDWLAERADIVGFCKREGLHCTPLLTAPTSGRRLDAIRSSNRVGAA
jgi:hypothetical protein